MYRLLLFFMFLSIGYLFPMQAQSIYSPNINIVDFVKDATQRLEQCIDRRGVSPKMATLQAANQLSAIIGNFQIVFGSQMQKSIATLDKQDRFYFRKVAELIAQLERGSNLIQLQQAALSQNEALRKKSLPLFLKNINTTFLTKHQDRSQITLMGDFPSDYITTYQPMGTFSHVEKYPIVPNQNQTDSAGYFVTQSTTTIKVGATPNLQPLTFEMPTNQYLPQSTQSVAIQKMTFALPYLDPSQQVLTATYTFWLGTPPPSPGNIELKQKYQQKTENIRAEKTRTYTQHAATKDIIETYCVSKTDQPTLISKSVNLVVEQSQGTKDQDWSYYRQQSDQNSCFVVETFNQAGGTSGQLDFHLAYQVKNTKHKENTNQESAVLNWEDTKTFPLTGKNWQLIFTDYLGRRNSFTRPTNNALIQVTVNNKELKITTPSITEALK